MKLFNRNKDKMLFTWTTEARRVSIDEVANISNAPADFKQLCAEDGVLFFIAYTTYQPIRTVKTFNAGNIKAEYHGS